MKGFRFIMNNRTIDIYKPYKLHIIDKGSIFANLFKLLLLLCRYNLQYAKKLRYQFLLYYSNY